MKIKEMKFTYCGWSGIPKETLHTKEQMEKIGKYKKAEIIARCQAACDHYSRKGLWTSYHINGKKIASQQSSLI